MILAQLLSHSINSRGRDISSWLLTYPRFIHSELMTHRDFSRNAASSRAIPLKTTIQNIQANPALPVWWGSSQKGMSSGPQLEGLHLEAAKTMSEDAMNRCMHEAASAELIGLHKSITNRWLEPWMHITTLVTATDLHNFFALRAHHTAQPEFQVLAYRMLEAYMDSIPAPISDGEWHFPFNDPAYTPPGLALSTEEKLKLNTARACWTSYNKPDKTEFQMQDAYDRHDDCIKNGHWSPLEHCAQAIPLKTMYPRSNFDTNLRLSGWYQYRQDFPQNRRTEDNTDLALILINRPEWTKTAGL